MLGVILVLAELCLLLICLIMINESQCILFAVVGGRFTR